MQQMNQPRGAANNVNPQPLAATARPPEVPTYQVETPGQRPPVTFAEAEAHNAFDLLTELRDHAMALRLEHKPAAFHLTELALSAAVVAWWSRWQPIAMHRAFLAGASLAEVAAATGTTEAEVYQRWHVWAGQQSAVLIVGRPAVEPDEVAAVEAWLRAP